MLNERGLAIQALEREAFSCARVMGVRAGLSSPPGPLFTVAAVRGRKRRGLRGSTAGRKPCPRGSTSPPAPRPAHVPPEAAGWRRWRRFSHHVFRPVVDILDPVVRVIAIVEAESADLDRDRRFRETPHAHAHRRRHHYIANLAQHRPLYVVNVVVHEVTARPMMNDFAALRRAQEHAAAGRALAVRADGTMPVVDFAVADVWPANAAVFMQKRGGGRLSGERRAQRCARECRVQSHAADRGRRPA